MRVFIIQKKGETMSRPKDHNYKCNLSRNCIGDCESCIPRIIDTLETKYKKEIEEFKREISTLTEIVRIQKFNEK